MNNWTAGLGSEHFLGLGAEFGDQAFDGLAAESHLRSDVFWDNFAPPASMDILSNPLTWDLPFENEALDRGGEPGPSGEVRDLFEGAAS